MADMEGPTADDAGTRPMPKRRRRPPFAYVAGAVGIFFMAACLFAGYLLSQSSIRAAQSEAATAKANEAAWVQKAGLLEHAVATTRNQLTAAGIKPAVPDVATLVGPRFVSSNLQSAPPKQVFNLPGNLQLICVDPTGGAVYTCSEQKITPTTQPPLPPPTTK